VFITDQTLRGITWQAFERIVMRLLLLEGFTGIRLVGQTRDGGADLIAHRGGKRWLFQVKRWSAPVHSDVVDRTLQALRSYAAEVPVIVSMRGFDEKVREHQRVLQTEGVPLQLWDRARLIERASRIDDAPLVVQHPGRFQTRNYQEDAITTVVSTVLGGLLNKALVVMATGLGKTFVAAEAIRRIRQSRPYRVLVIAHTNELVYQLERAFWPFIRGSDATIVWNGGERPDITAIANTSFVFACIDTLAAAVARPDGLPFFDAIVIDECHHVGGSMYQSVIAETHAGEPANPFLLGLTATPWRPDETDLEAVFGPPLVSVDLVTGLRNGFLANVDYRMYTDNIDWDRLAELKGNRFSPRAINRTLFISEWDDAVVLALRDAWKEQKDPRAIVFCGTVEHAERMRDRINALGFCRAEAIFSKSSAGRSMEPWDRNRILADFDDGLLGVVCAVDIFNEGIDVPDVNIIVFQRVTHSRRIFIQQLGRGLRLTPGKDHVIVLDFVSDVRRFAAGLELKDQLDEAGPRPGAPARIRLHNQVEFRRLGGADPATESFLRQWLEDVAAIEAAGQDASVLKYPPPLPAGHGGSR
jgi:superfamily II DNA or RNA helicase